MTVVIVVNVATEKASKVIQNNLSNVSLWNQTIYQKNYNDTDAYIAGRINQIHDAHEAGLYKESERLNNQLNEEQSSMCMELRKVRHLIITNDAKAKYDAKYGN